MFRRQLLTLTAGAAFVALVAFFGMKGLPVMAQETAAPAATAADTLVLELSTGGVIHIAMRPDKAPKHVERIKTLAKQGFYNNTIFHRVIEDFMAQGGDPTGTGMGGSKLADLPAEFNDLPHLRGTASMARSNSPNSANSQFFICFGPTPFLDGQYTVWGRVIEGMDAVDGIERGEPPATPTKIVKAYVLADKK
jgi:cyclophilin family peptidyl-prolyl cis-trans isomerase